MRLKASNDPKQTAIPAKVDHASGMDSVATRSVQAVV
jgi:hypothetical protein